MQRMHEAGILPDVATYTILLKHQALKLQHEKSLRKAFSLNDVNIEKQRNIDWTEKHRNLAENVKKFMTKYHQLDRPFYQAYFKLYYLLDDIEKCIEITQEMKELGFPISKMMARNYSLLVLRAYPHCGEEIKKRIFSSALWETRTEFDASFSRKLGVETKFSTLTKLKDDKKSLSTSYVNSVLTSLADLRGYKEMKQYWASVSERGVVGDKATYTTLIVAAKRNESYQDVDYWFSEMRKNSVAIDTLVCDLVVSSLKEAGIYEDALKVVEWMRKKGIPLSLITYYYACWLYLYYQRTEDAVAFMNELNTADSRYIIDHLLGDSNLELPEKDTEIIHKFFPFCYHKDETPNPRKAAKEKEVLATLQRMRDGEELETTSPEIRQILYLDDILKASEEFMPRQSHQEKKESKIKVRE
eukprot:TRINITY_DN7702_c0_g1_i1.p1 TRINITY_DN7702_c0_g1~~TRINITY_DN7702_c0_g1_i1.p1  ORF type:complete len:484 (-),score=109.72 TRINITY_DN7702_c0_g1_i1:3-1247(-)